MVTRIGDGEAGIGPTANQYDEPRQIAVYRKYLLLQSLAGLHFQGSLAGKLVACLGFGLGGSELAVATTIAGGAFLGIEAEPQRLKTAVRNASCDFMVNTLDEALRVLKNEVRKGKPLSVGLLGRGADTLPAIVERGVQPDLVADPAQFDQLDSDVSREDSDVGATAERHALQQLVARGTVIVPRDESIESVSESSTQSEVAWSAGSPADMRRLEQIAVDWLPREDDVRRRWVEQAGAYFYRQVPLERVLGLRRDELASFLNALRKARPLLGPASARWHDSDGAPHKIDL